MNDNTEYMPATEFLQAIGYEKKDFKRGPAETLGLLNKHGIQNAKPVRYARGIMFLVEKDIATRLIAQHKKPKSDGATASRTADRERRSLARAVLHICKELGIELPNHRFINTIAERNKEETEQ